MTFQGFEPHGIRFLKQLKKNNDRDWFNARKEIYLNHLVAPSKAFLQELSKSFAKHFPTLEVTSRSMGRIYRDTRFSDDKSPYHPWISFTIRDRRSPKEFTPRFYLGFDPTGLAFGAGIYSFSTAQRDTFRTLITEEPTAKSFREAVKKMKKAGFEPRGKALKKIPLGFDPNHANAEFLLYNGLYMSLEEDLPKEFYTKDFVNYFTKKMKSATPLLNWMADFSKRSPRTLDRFFSEKEESTSLIF